MASGPAAPHHHQLGPLQHALVTTGVILGTSNRPLLAGLSADVSVDTRDRPAQAAVVAPAR